MSKFSVHSTRFYVLLLMIEHNILGQTFILCPEKVIFWKEKQMLILADVHLGKAGHFRKSGIPVSDLIHSKDILIIEKLINAFKPEAVIFLGDLFHSDHNQGWEIFRRWMKTKAPLQFILVRGNHDVLMENDYRITNLELVDFLDIAPFHFTHHPQEEHEGDYNIAGHIHPAVRLRGKARQSLRVPVFYFGKNQALLPAFGQFTGTAKISIRKSDNIYAIAQNEVIKMT